MTTEDTAARAATGARIEIHSEGRPAAPAPAAAEPGAAPAAAVSDVLTCIDEKNRTIKVRKIKLLEQYRLLKLVGGEVSTGNPVAFMIATTAFMITEIDGDAMGRPTSERELDARIAMMGDEGYEAIMKAAIAAWGGVDIETDVKPADVKNS